jgi:hypothetical protein
MSRHDRKWDPIKDRAFVAEVRRKLDRSTQDHRHDSIRQRIQRFETAYFVYPLLGMTLLAALVAVMKGAPPLPAVLFGAATVSIGALFDYLGRPPRYPEVVRLLRGAKDPRLYGVLSRAALDEEPALQQMATDYLLRVLPHVRPEYGDLLGHDEVGAVAELLLQSVDAELAVKLIVAVERTRDLRFERHIGRIARADCPSGQDERARGAAESCLKVLERHRQELREQARLLRPAEDPDESSLLRPAGSDDEPEGMLLRPAGSGEGDG